jgi:hypothetical protein
MLLAVRKSCTLVLAAVAAAGFLSLTAGCQSPKTAAPTSSTATPTSPSAPALTPYTASDQSASAGVPPGWQVTKGQQTVIGMTGPGGVNVTLGATFIANNAAFQLGQKGSNGADLSMPYASTLAQKLAMILEQGSAISGQSISQFAVASATPIQLPPALGQCGRFVAGFSGAQGPTKIMAVFCSLPLDSGGDYKNVLLFASAPSAAAAEAAPVAQSIFRSYQIPPTWLQKKLAPFNTPPPTSAAGAANSAAEAAMLNRATTNAARSANTSANCFDLEVLRETPTYDLPRSCGGTKPD